MNILSEIFWPHFKNHRIHSLESSIPKSLHFIWGLLGDGNKLSQQQNNYFNQWSTLHVNWQKKIHDQNSIQDLASEYHAYPYAIYSKNIQRCDVSRMMLMHKYGGFYMDLDTEPQRSLDVLLNYYPKAKVFVGVETHLNSWQARRNGKRYPIRNRRPELRRRIANYFLGSVPGHPFWIDMLKFCQARSGLSINEPYDVLYTTGPDVITEVIEKTAGQYDDVVVLSKKVLNRLLTHHCSGSWRKL